MKTFKSEKLMIAFLEFMFEDLEPVGLSEEESELFESLRDRMNSRKARADAWAKGWQISSWWWRPKASKEQAKSKNETSKKQAKNNQDKDKEEDKVKDIDKEKDNKKNKYLDFVYLSEDEHQKLISQLGNKLTDELIDKLNNYIWSTGKRYKSHYFTILNWSKNEVKVTTHTNLERERQAELHRQKIAEQIEAFNSWSKQDSETLNQDGWYNRRENISLN